MEGRQRRKHIVERLQAGEPQSAVARELGVSRQAISRTWRKYQAFGEAFLDSKLKGRYKERDGLDRAETETCIAWLRAHGPEAVDRERWDLYSVKRAVFKLTGKRVRTEVAHAVLHSAGLCSPKLPADPIRGQAEPTGPGPATGKPPEAIPSVEDMDRMNAETWKSVPWELPFTESRPGHRTGRHAKGKRSSTTPSRKKRGKKRK